MTGHWGVVLLLLNSKVKVDVIDRAGLTPLASAMMQRQYFDQQIRAVLTLAASSKFAEVPVML